MKCPTCDSKGCWRCFGTGRIQPGERWKYKIVGGHTVELTEAEKKQVSREDRISDTYKEE